jgi:hypothetical protein
MAVRAELLSRSIWRFNIDHRISYKILKQPNGGLTSDEQRLSGIGFRSGIRLATAPL